MRRVEGWKGIKGVRLIVYIVNFVTLLIIGLVAEKWNDRKVVKILFCSYAWLQLTLIAALRWGNGVDYNQYYNAFIRISNADSWVDVFTRERYEIGFLAFYRLMSHITSNIIVCLFVFYGIMYALLMCYVYRYCEVKWIPVVAYVAFDYFAVSLCFMRQSMAMVIGLYALEMMKKRKWYWMILSVLLVLVASTFHVSALVLLLCIVFSYINYQDRRVQIAAIIASVFLYVGCDFLLEHILVGPFSKYADYLESSFMGGNHILVVFYPIFVFGLVAYLGKQLCGEDSSFGRMIPVLYLGTFLSVMTTRHYIIERLSLYITVYNIRVVSKVLHWFRKEAKDQARKWNYQLAIYSAIFISIGAFAYGLHNDRYWIRPFRLNEHDLNYVEFFRSSD